MEVGALVRVQGYVTKALYALAVLKRRAAMGYYNLNLCGDFRLVSEDLELGDFAVWVVELENESLGVSTETRRLPPLCFGAAGAEHGS